MSYARGVYKRSLTEKIFLIFFLPAVFLMYVVYKYPEKLVELGLLDTVRSVYFLDKSPSFWYATLYTGIVSIIALKVLFKNRSPYKKGKNPALSPYQRNKFISIFIVQFGLLYLLPYFITPLLNGVDLFFDPTKPTVTDAYVYISRGFTSWGGMFYVFILVPLSVYFFGKRYCSWFCACGNLAETIGITKWGAAWVKYKTPTGKWAERLEKMQIFFMLFGIAYGLVIFMDFLNIVTATSLLAAGKAFQDLVVDLIFGALIGIGAYPFLGTRIWCRYGCPLAKFMEWTGRYGKSRFEVAANEKCKGLDLCSQVCPMGIDVASFAHENKKPLNGSFSLDTTTCIGCGGCVDICPVNALEFKPIWKN